jgi:hypothetical protein
MDEYKYPCEKCEYYQKGVAISGNYNADFNRCHVNPEPVLIGERITTCRFFKLKRGTE